MKQRNASLPVLPLITLLGGVALGGLAVAFLTTKSGRAFRHRLASLGERWRGGGGAGDPVEDEVDWGEAMFI